MNYFISCLYGEYGKYKKLKTLANLKEDDRLWIVGGAIGNPDVDGSVEIVMDAHSDPRVTLVLGDNEFSQVMVSTTDDPELAEQWEEYSYKTNPQGVELTDFFKDAPEEDKAPVVEALIAAEVSACTKIGGSYFYMVPGYPQLYKGDKEIMTWQHRVAASASNINYAFFGNMRSDPNVSFAFSNPTCPATAKNTFLILGQTSPENAAKQANVDIPEERVVYKNRTLCIGRDSLDDPIPLLGIDAAGFFIKGLV